MTNYKIILALRELLLSIETLVYNLKEGVINESTAKDIKSKLNELDKELLKEEYEESLHRMV